MNATCFHHFNSSIQLGDMRVDCCGTHEHVIISTCFQHDNMHLYTLRSQGDGVRKQKDYMRINKMFRKSIQQVKGYPGADNGSNHVHIVGTLRLKLRNLHQKKKWSSCKFSCLTHMTNTGLSTYSASTRVRLTVAPYISLKVVIINLHKTLCQQ